MKNKTQKQNAPRSTIYALRESGQVLLIVLMLMAVVVTVVLTTTFTSRTDTQITTLEQEDQKALAAAEAGIEAALKQDAAIPDLTSVGNLSSTIDRGSVGITPSSGTSFESPLIQPSQAHTFYLGSYSSNPAPNPPTFGNSSSNQVTICFGNSSSQPALDIALIKDTSTNLRRYAVSEDPGGQIENSDEALSGGSLPAVCSGAGYSYGYQIPGGAIGTNSRFLVVRVLFEPTRLLVSQSGLPSQGRIIDSQATSQTGVTKKIRLVQYHPQIPAEFFITDF